MRLKKTVICFCLVNILTSSLLADTVKPKERNKKETTKRKVEVTIDPRVELMSVIFHLAGNEEYNKCRSKRMTRNVNEHFAGYKKHPVIEMAKRLRKNRSVGYDAVMSMAVHLTDVNSCAELVPFEPRPASLESRWRIDEAREFLVKCRGFVKDTDFHSFLRENKELYNVAAQRLQNLMDSQANLGWFDEFFGPRDDVQFNLVVSILNGPCCYGPRVKIAQQTRIYCILGAWNIGWFGWGNPQFDASNISTIVHEFSHSYCNPVVDKYINELRTFGEKFYPKLEKQMKEQAYAGWQTMMYESLVRVCEVRYAMANNGKARAEQIANYQISRGFPWTKELAAFLDEYESNRDKYPTFESFFPRVVEFFSDYAALHD